MAEMHILPRARPLVLLYSWRFVMVPDMTSPIATLARFALLIKALERLSGGIITVLFLEKSTV